VAGDLPPAPGEGPTTGPPPGSAQWAPAFPMQPPPRPRAWSAIALAALAVVLGVAALIVALTRPTSNQSSVSSPTSTTPSFTADQTAAAHQKLCDAYKLAARSVQIDTNGDNPALAGVASVNAAVTLEQAVNSVPAIASSDRTAALALASAYTTATAMGSWSQRDEPAFRAEVDDVNAKDAAMKKVCGIS
jgi:hypothetical protein